MVDKDMSNISVASLYTEVGRLMAENEQLEDRIAELQWDYVEILVYVLAQSKELRKYEKILSEIGDVLDGEDFASAEENPPCRFTKS